MSIKLNCYDIKQLFCVFIECVYLFIPLLLNLLIYEPLASQIQLKLFTADSLI